MKNILFVLMTLFAAHVQAHGGDEHKDHAHAAPSAVLETSAKVPMLTAQSETFEIVARLYDDELGLYIDDWVSNTPVLNAEVEVEFKGRKARAVFHADHGDYAVSDPEMVKALHASGEHALIFSIVAGEDIDLLTGELHVHEEEGAVATVLKPGNRVLIGIVGAVLLIGCALAVRHLLRDWKNKQGGLS